MMAEKRFSWEVIDNDCLFYDDGAVIDYDDVVDELNQLHENLTGCNKTANNAIETIKALTEENKKLKETIETQNFNYDNAKSIIHDSEKQIRNLKDKNQQYEILVKSLKEQNQKLKLRLKDLGVEYF